MKPKASSLKISRKKKKTQSTNIKNEKGSDISIMLPNCEFKSEQIAPWSGCRAKDVGEPALLLTLHDLVKGNQETVDRESVEFQPA